MNTGWEAPAGTRVIPAAHWRKALLTTEIPA
jgi:hypothetical protein